MRELRPLDPARVIPPRYQSPLSDELSTILGGLSERAVANHLRQAAGADPVDLAPDPAGVYPPWAPAGPIAGASDR